MEKKATDTEPPQNRRKTKKLTQIEKMESLVSHTLHSRLNEGTKNRRKRKGLNHLAMGLRKSHEDSLQFLNQKCERLSQESWRQAVLDADTRMFVRGIPDKGDQFP